MLVMGRTMFEVRCPFEKMKNTQIVWYSQNQNPENMICLWQKKFFFICLRNKFMAFECLISPPFSLIKKGKWKRWVPHPSKKWPWAPFKYLSSLVCSYVPWQQCSFRIELRCRCSSLVSSSCRATTYGLWRMTLFPFITPSFSVRKKNLHTVPNDWKCRTLPWRNKTISK